MFEQFIITIQIILIDIVMAADNAIIIGMLAAVLPKKIEKELLLGELRRAFILEYFCFWLQYLIRNAWLKIAGGVLTSLDS